MRTDSATTSNRGCVIESLETRRLCSVTVPGVTGHFNGGLLFNAGEYDVFDCRIANQQKSRFSGTFENADGSEGVLVGTVNKRGVATFTFQSENLVNNYKGKVIATLAGDGSSLNGKFSVKLGRHSYAGKFAVEKVSVLGEKSG